MTKRIIRKSRAKREKERKGRENAWNQRKRKKEIFEDFKSKLDIEVRGFFFHLLGIMD